MQISKQLGRMLLIGILLLAPAPMAASEPAPTEIHRFLHSGDGRIRMTSRKNGSTFSGHYRRGAGTYDVQALKNIHKVFDAPYRYGEGCISLRLIEFLDYLEDHLRPGAWITITSGYRSPEYNKNIRQQGALAAKASLHQYGMAADVIIEGVPAKRLWMHVKGMKFGGAGYYHGETVHLDVGPARSWDQASSGVGTGISDDNKLVGITSDYDRYLPGETVILRFIRMTAFPISVNPRFELVSQQPDGTTGRTRAFQPRFKLTSAEACPSFSDIDQMDGIRWRLPSDLPPGMYGILARFCPNSWEKMPKRVLTPHFEIVAKVEKGTPQ
jgi:uncharacterized protein YcbK (DUF882 family)